MIWISYCCSLFLPLPFTLLTSSTSNYIHSAPSIWPSLLSCIPPRHATSIYQFQFHHVWPVHPCCSLPFLTAPNSCLHSHFHILEPLANQWISARPCCCFSFSIPLPTWLFHTHHVVFLLTLLSLFFVLHKRSVPIALSHSPLLSSFLSLPLRFPVGFCLHFSVNLPENALAVMKAEGRGNPPGFH